MKSPQGKSFALELLTAVLYALLIIGLILFTAGDAPQWIYQGF